MLDEQGARAPEFRVGRHIRLADGQRWMFPSPPAPRGAPRETGASTSDTALTDAEYVSLIDAVESSEDEPDLKRAELALAIFLLSRNYDLNASEFERLFDFGQMTEGSSEAQEHFRELAMDHVRSARGASPDHSIPARSSLRSLTSRLFYRLWPS